MELALRAGVARVDITPTVPVDLFGTVRQHAPASRVHGQLSATALVVEDDDLRIVLVAADLGSLSVAAADRIRSGIADAVATTVDRVLLNVSHTHAAPHASREPYKFGGDPFTYSDGEIDYIARLPQALTDAARVAALRMVPARIGAGAVVVPSFGGLPLTVNRRELDQAQRSFVGWRRDGACDRELLVLRVDRADGTTLATAVNFQCHPVVLLADPPVIGPDFVGPLRREVERATSAPCLFLQGAGGDVLPLEAFHATASAEVRFGSRLAGWAIAAWSNIESTRYAIEEGEVASMSPMRTYRRRPADDQRTLLSAANVRRSVALQPMPTAEELRAFVAKARADQETAGRAGAGPETINPLRLREAWGLHHESVARTGPLASTVDIEIQGLRVGDFAVVGVPGEAFNEIGAAVKRSSPFAATLFAGYSNGVTAYFPTEAEFAFGGYEVELSHMTYCLPSPVSPAVEAALVEGCDEVLDDLAG